MPMNFKNWNLQPTLGIFISWILQPRLQIWCFSFEICNRYCKFGCQIWILQLWLQIWLLKSSI